MKTIKYFFQFIFIIIFFSLFKILGLRFSSAIGGKLLEIIGKEQKNNISKPKKVIFLDLKNVPIIIKKKIRNNGLVIKGKILCKYIIGTYFKK